MNFRALAVDLIRTNSNINSCQMADWIRCPSRLIKFNCTVFIAKLQNATSVLGLAPVTN